MGLLSEKDKKEMAARAEARREINRDQWRESIQVQQLLKVLEDHALGKGRTKMTPAKLKAIEILLGKALPDLATVKMDVEAKNVTMNLTTTFTKKA